MTLTSALLWGFGIFVLLVLILVAGCVVLVVVEEHHRAKYRNDTYRGRDYNSDERP